MNDAKRAEWREGVTLGGGKVGRPRMTDEDRAAGKARSVKLYQKKRAERKAAGLPLTTGRARKSPGPRRLPLDGRVFGELTVMHYHDTIGLPKARKSRWKLRCSCGVELVLRTDQLVAKYGRKHCGHARGQMFAPTESMPGDRPKRGGSGVLNPPGRVRRDRAKAHRPAPAWTPEELAERERDAAERLERKRLQAENAERARRGERMIRPEIKEMDGPGWVRLLRTMRQAGARWAELTMELDSASAFGVTREMVEVAV